MPSGALDSAVGGTESALGNSDPDISRSDIDAAEGVVGADVADFFMLFLMVDSSELRDA
jgi:hypothetical protein